MNLEQLLKAADAGIILPTVTPPKCMTAFTYAFLDEEDWPITNVDFIAKSPLSLNQDAHKPQITTPHQELMPPKNFLPKFL